MVEFRPPASEDELAALMELAAHARGPGGGGHGTWDLRTGRRYENGPRALALYLPSEREAAESARYHDYCREHTYPFAGNEDPNRPPAPSRHHDGEWIGLSWVSIRRHQRQPVLF